MTYHSPVAAQDFHADTRSFFKGRAVLVLGGSGFIGSHVVEQLLAMNARPLVLSRRADPPFLSHLRGQITLLQGDLADPATAADATRRASVVLNLAAEVAGLEWNAAHPASIFMNNLQLFIASVQAAVAAKVERYLVTSSACVYPRQCTVPTPEEEGFVNEPEPTNAGYGWAKRMEEFVGRSAVAEFGLSVAIARPYNAYGPRDNFDPASSHVIPALIRKAVEAESGTFQVWGDGSHSRDFLYVDDFARGLLEVAARHVVAEPINLGAATECTIREVAQTIAKEVSDQTGHRVAPRFDPTSLTGQPRRACDTTRAQQLLGFSARVPLSVGLRKTVEWYLANAHRFDCSDAQ